MQTHNDVRLGGYSDAKTGKIYQVIKIQHRDQNDSPIDHYEFKTECGCDLNLLTEDFSRFELVNIDGIICKQM